MTKEIELITNPKLRAKHMNRTEVLDRVGNLQTLPKAKCSTTKQVAEFYGVKPQDINAVVYLNRNEIDESGVRQARHNDLKERLFDVAGSTKAWVDMRQRLGIATSVTNLYPKQAVLLIGFILEGSEIAKKVRELVLEDEDIFEPTVTTPVTVVEPTVQKQHNNMQSGELIKTEVNEANEIIVSGRELHEFLEVNSNYTTWIKRMIDYGFAENIDYMEIWSDSKNGNVVSKEGSPQQMSAKGYQLNHVLKLDMAKEISMIQRNDKGKQARQYFIETEKKYKSQSVVPIHSYMIENPIERAKQWIEEQQEKMLLETKVQEQVVVIEHKQSIIEGYANDIPDAEKRQILVNLIRSCYSGATISERWARLYKEFNMVYHKNVSLLTRNHNLKYDTKINILDYIEHVLGMLDELYELGMKHFAVDANKVIEKQKKLYLID